ncbi:four helix bundle protein [Poritiphilus flavus]|uniref:Four helix bundle protein n=1 Tax=Poritiphilus flavus TaxID=2697053 RepID=A0A6L9EGR4_9FLAO|nr:four helix bundle protein [Poritiphilus flavus]NAS13957.1 four helix bundle protein [Poritiphilus flavus]
MEYTELEVWKKARALVSMIYTLTKEFPKDEQYGLTLQLRRSAILVPSNIAEGCGRRTATDTIQFLHIARGSLYELETQLYLGFDQAFISNDRFDKLFERIVECKKLLKGFINYYKKNKS